MTNEIIKYFDMAPIHFWSLSFANIIMFGYVDTGMFPSTQY